MIAAQYEVGQDRPSLESPVAHQGTGGRRRRTTARPERPLPRSGPGRARPWRTSCPRNRRWQRPWNSSGCRPVRCLDARSSWDPRWILRLRRLLRTRDISTSYTSIRRSWPSAPVWRCARFRAGNRPRIVVTEHNVWSSHARLTRLADRLTAGAVRNPPRGVAPRSTTRSPPGSAARTRVVRYGVDAAEVRREGEHRRRGARAPRRGRRRDPDRHRGQPPRHEGLPRPARRRPGGHRAAVDNVRFVAVGRGPLEHELRPSSATARPRRPLPVPRLPRRTRCGSCRRSTCSACPRTTRACRSRSWRRSRSACPWSRPASAGSPRS